MPVDELQDFFTALPLDDRERHMAERILTEITSRLTYLNEVGLGYLTLDRLSSTLSGGESQRINLATSLGSSLVGSLYILDEPTTGLHTADIHKLLDILQRLVAGGDTVVVIEHNLDVIKTADYIIDLGPEGGDKGGTVVATGRPEDIVKVPASYTGKFLRPLLEEKNA
jgi:excinuclease ABC subunit A